MVRILGTTGPDGSQSATSDSGVILLTTSLGCHPPEGSRFVETWTLIGDGLAAAPAGFRREGAMARLQRPLGG